LKLRSGFLQLVGAAPVFEFYSCCFFRKSPLNAASLDSSKTGSAHAILALLGLNFLPASVVSRSGLMATVRILAVLMLQQIQKDSLYVESDTLSILLTKDPRHANTSPFYRRPSKIK
jgi:hypothetical protein